MFISNRSLEKRLEEERRKIYYDMDMDRFRVEQEKRSSELEYKVRLLEHKVEELEYRIDKILNGREKSPSKNTFNREFNINDDAIVCDCSKKVIEE